MKSRVDMLMNAANENKLNTTSWHPIHENLSKCLGLEASATHAILDETSSLLSEPADSDRLLTALHRVSEALKEDVPLDVRPYVFRCLNKLLVSLKPRSEERVAVYKVLFDAVTLLKDQLDHACQSDEDQAQDEWEELEKCVYLLCAWEDGLSEGVAKEI